jgi:hypothetical protein
MGRVRSTNEGYEQFVVQHLGWEKPKGKRPFLRYRRKCESNVNMDVNETGWGVF